MGEESKEELHPLTLLGLDPDPNVVLDFTFNQGYYNVNPRLGSNEVGKWEGVACVSLSAWGEVFAHGPVA